MERNKAIPVLYVLKQDCCGCTACYAICPKSAITMQPDEEGFDYPIINPNLCARCHSCIRVCPIKGARYEQAAKKERAEKVSQVT